MPGPQPQPFDRLPDLADSSIVAGWLNKGVLSVGDAAADYGPDGYDMTRVNNPRQERVGMHFTAASLQYLRSVVGAPFQAGDSFGVISAWIKLDSVGVIHHIFTTADEAGDSDYWTFGVDAANHLNITALLGGVSRGVAGTTALVADRWYFVSGMTDGGTWALYLDNNRETVTPAGAGNDGTWIGDVADRDNVCIAALRTNAILQYFDGTIKDVRYYGLTVQVPSDVSYVYKKSVPDDDLVLWTPDGMEDLSRYERVLSRFNSVICGRDMRFDSGAPADYIRTPAIDFTDQSISLWFMPDSVGNNEVLFNNVPHADNRTVLVIRDDATVRVGHWGGASYRSKSGGVYEIGKWNHLFMTYDAAPTRTTRAWLNGVELAGTADPSSGNGISLRLGMSSSGTSPYNGGLWDVRVWNSVKSEAYALEVFNKGEVRV